MTFYLNTSMTTAVFHPLRVTGLEINPGSRISPGASGPIYKEVALLSSTRVFVAVWSVESWSMMLLVVLTCLLAGCLAQKPHPCSSPPLLSGGLSVSTQNEKLWAYARYLYDALGQRVRIMELGTYENKSFTFDALLLFRESTMYEINEHDRTCKKKPLKADFQPMAIPKDASLLAQYILGSSSGPGEGLLVNAWGGDLPEKAGKFMTTVTEFGCIPINTVYHTSQFGWVVTTFFNNVVGIEDPGQLNPPDFCVNEEMRADEEQTDFLSLFLKKL